MGCLPGELHISNRFECQLPHKSFFPLVDLLSTFLFSYSVISNGILQGLAVLSLSTQFFLLKPHGCGKSGFLCDSHSSLEIAIFYLSIYLVALGNGASEPSLATFGSDQFDEEDALEKRLKTSFFSYFYVALNLGSMFSETVLAYLENSGNWLLGFWIPTFCGSAALALFLSGSLRYRHFRPCGNPLSRLCQVIVAATRKLKVEVPSHADGFYESREGATATTGNRRRILHTEDFRYAY